MDNHRFCLSDAAFTFALSPDPSADFPHHCPVWDDTMRLSYTSGTDIQQERSAGRELTIVGLCVDTHGEISQRDIGRSLLEKASDAEELFRQTDRLAGKYIILYSDETGCYLMGDATGSLPVNYSFHGGAIRAASTDQIVASMLRLPLSPYSQKIRMGSALSQGLPNDLTMFDHVHALLPNHYLHVSEKRAIRVRLRLPEAGGGKDFRKLVERSIPLIAHTAEEYRKRYDLICPLTSGYDSRVVFSFLKKMIPDLTCYTMWHPGFTEETGDLAVPLRICGDCNTRYERVRDQAMPEKLVSALKAYTGEYTDLNTLDLANTLRVSFPEKAIVNGDIIGQVGKSVLGNTLPVKFATPRYFQCKIHNTEPLTRKELRKYVDGVRAAGCFEQVFDLFAVENRCGRWAAQGGTVYALASVPSLNIFNSREVIKLWMAVPRKLRIEKYIHETILQHNDPHLLEFPFNPGDKLGFLKKNPCLFLLATYLKFGLQCLTRRNP